MRQLQQHSSVRNSEGRFVAEGLRLTHDFLAAGMLADFALIGQQPLAQQWRLQHPEVECIDVSDVIMNSVTAETTAPGVIVIFYLSHVDPGVTRMDTLDPVLILDSLKDPGNLGACLRVAAASSCSLVILTPGCVDPFSPKVIRGGMGAHARLQIIDSGWDEVKKICRGRSVWAADANGDHSYDAISWTSPTALIIGSETAGLSAEARAVANGIVTIPLANNVESLNAAVACGVILFEAARQRRHMPG